MLGLPIDLSDLHSCPQCHHELVPVLGLLVPVVIFLRVPTELHPIHSQLCDYVLKSLERVHQRLKCQVVGVERRVPHLCDRSKEEGESRGEPHIPLDCLNLPNGSNLGRHHAVRTVHNHLDEVCNCLRPRVRVTVLNRPPQVT